MIFNQFKFLVFTGKSGSGKSYSTEYLVNRYGYKHLSFASTVRELVSKSLNIWPSSKEQEYELKANDLSYHQHLIIMGKIVNSIYPQYFTHALLSKIQHVNTGVVISDLRRPYEYDALLQIGLNQGYYPNIYRVENKNCTRKLAPIDHLLDDKDIKIIENTNDLHYLNILDGLHKNVKATYYKYPIDEYFHKNPQIRESDIHKHFDGDLFYYYRNNVCHKDVWDQSVKQPV